MRRCARSVQMAAALLTLLVCAGCSTSTLVQSSEVLPLAQRVVDYHDAHLPAENSDALAQSATLLSALRAEEVSQQFLAGLLGPVLTRYAAQVEADADLSALERRIRMDDAKILRRVAVMSDE